MPQRAPTQTHHARNLRHEATEAEQRLWYRLRNRQVEQLKFRRQHPVGPFIADLLCDEATLIVEVDGGQHAERREEDKRRTDWLEARGYRLLRFWNNEVLVNTEAVLEEIRRVALERSGG